MADTWQTIEQAAVTLGLSVRTVNRHITAGKLQSRLFEGRREVLVTGVEAEVFQPKSASVAPPSAEPNFTFRSAGTAGGAGRGSVATSPAQTADYANGHASPGVGSRMSDRESALSDDSSYGDPNRQRVTPDVPSERPWDVQTMLALTDSIDDKATLAVAAYQTLARSAETQVQSLRKVAFGAWGVVGVMAVGITVAVGWAAVTITSAEKSAGYLKEQLDQAKQKADKLETAVANHERESRELATYKGREEGAQEGRKDQQQRNDDVNRRLSELERARVAERMGFSTNPAVGASAIIPPANGVPLGSPATQGARDGRTPTGGGGGAPGSRPTAHPTDRPAPYQNPTATPRPTGNPFGPQ